MVARLDLEMNCFDYMIDLEQMNCCHFGLLPTDVDLDWCRHLFMVIFTGTMWKRWNGSWYRVLTVHLLVVLIRQLLGRIISTSLVDCKTLPQCASTIMLTLYSSASLALLYSLLIGGEFTSPNQERFHHYKVKAALNCSLLLLSLFF